MVEKIDFESIVETFPNAVILVKPVFTENKVQSANILYANPMLKKLTASEEFPSDAPLQECLSQAIENYGSANVSFYSQKCGLWLKMTANALKENFLITLQDCSEEKEKEQKICEQKDELEKNRAELDSQLRNFRTLNSQLKFAAYHDSLTNLYNRAWLTSEMHRCITQNFEFGIILFDIDNTKDVNESQGHRAGDEMLRQAAALLRTVENENIIASRFGGDEFVILFKNLPARSDIKSLGDKTQSLFNAEGMGISGGIAIYPDDASDCEDLLKFADMAKFDVKKNGKNSISFFNSVMQEKFLRKLSIETKLSKALAEGSFQLYYQPQYNIKTEKLRGFEALLRWHDDELGWISPEQFIPLAEETTKIITSIGDWVMETAMSVLAKWERKFNFEGIISVNVSPIQFKQTDFIEKLIEKVIRFGITKSHLEIEITEGVLIDNLQDTVSKLEIIRQMGIGISLDDFGTGYSSLHYLQMLPLTTLKIDKSFVANIQNGRESNITESIVSMVSKMGLDTIAEGVETNEQLEILKKFKCNNLQGFLKGRPMPVELCEKLLSKD